MIHKHCGELVEFKTTPRQPRFDRCCTNISCRFYSQNSHYAFKSHSLYVQRTLRPKKGDLAVILGFSKLFLCELQFFPPSEQKAFAAKTWKKDYVVVSHHDLKLVVPFSSLRVLKHGS